MDLAWKVFSSLSLLFSLSPLLYHHAYPEGAFVGCQNDNFIAVLLPLEDKY